jgi:hypothetical protein
MINHFIGNYLERLATWLAAGDTTLILCIVSSGISDK